MFGMVGYYDARDDDDNNNNDVDKELVGLLTKLFFDGTLFIYDHMTVRQHRINTLLTSTNTHTQARARMYAFASHISHRERFK